MRIIGNLTDSVFGFKGKGMGKEPGRQTDFGAWVFEFPLRIPFIFILERYRIVGLSKPERGHRHGGMKRVGCYL